MQSGRESENERVEIHFEAAEQLCMVNRANGLDPARRQGAVYCSKKLNEESRKQATACLKYLSGVLGIVSYYRSHLANPKSGMYNPVPREFDLADEHDVMALSTYYPYPMSHLFLQVMELHQERCFD